MSKIAVKVGALSVEYEGPDDFIKDGLLEFMAEVAELATKTPNVQTPLAVGSPTPVSGPIPNISVKTISTKLGNSKGSDLAKAAAAFLTLVQGRETFSQADLLTAMKSATGIYKQSTHGKNSGNIVSSLMASGFLIETSSGTYSVAQSQRDQLAGILASG